MIKIAFIGDLVGNQATSFLQKSIPCLKQQYHANIIIANGENAAQGKGLSEKQAGDLKRAGVAMITSGNHIWNMKHRNVLNVFPNFVLRPHNYPSKNHGNGIGFLDYKHYTIIVVNLIGRSFMNDPVDNPFYTIEKELPLLRAKSKFIFVDFHAEATAEKQAMAQFLDGHVTAVIGTHTHITTADECVLPNGTAYITDVGMTGVTNSVIGMKSEIAIKRFRNGIPCPYQIAEGHLHLSAVLVDIDEETGKATKIERLRILEDEIK